MLNETQGKPLVSVIIPVYNVENYIEETLISVLSQHYLKSRLFVLMMDLKINQGI